MTKKAKAKIIPIDPRELLMRAVDGLVGAFADSMVDIKGGSSLEMQAHFYRVLEVNCAARAELSDRLADEHITGMPGH